MSMRTGPTLRAVSKDPRICSRYNRIRSIFPPKAPIGAFVFSAGGVVSDDSPERILICCFAEKRLDHMLYFAIVAV